MNSADNTTPEPYRRIAQRAIRLLDTLAHGYFQINPEYGEDGFRERVFTRMDNFSITNPGEFVLANGEVRSEKVIEFLGLEGEAIKSDMGWIYIACAHTVASARAIQAGDQNLAWDLLCEAHKFLGAQLATNQLETIFTQTVASRVNSQRAEHAANGLHDKHKKMRARAIQLVHERNDWRSQAAAARKLTIPLQAEFKNLLANPESTIEKWFSEMSVEEKEKCFLTSKRKSKNL